MTLDNGEVWGAQARLSHKESHYVCENIPSPFYRSSQVRDEYNHLKLTFRGGWGLEFRAYNDGVAYRFVNKRNSSFCVVNEEVEYNFEEDCVATVAYVDKRNASFKEQFFSSFENIYTSLPLSQLDEKRLVMLPAVVDVGNGKKVCLIESDLEAYPGLYLHKTDKGTLQGMFAPYPIKWHQGGHNNLQAVVDETEDYIARINGQRTFPWRGMVIANADKELAASDLVYRLAAPMQLTDTHSHLYAEEFDADRAEALQRARDAGVGTLLLPAIDSLTHERLFTMAAAEPAMCHPMMGLHPTSVNDNPRWREELRTVERYLAEPPSGLTFCAVGEIGLDYYWSRDFVAEQREAFIEQCRLAASLDLPVAIHTRAAWNDMYDILREECDRARQRGERLRGVLHAFSEDADTFRRLRDCGDWLFGIGGVVTFRKSVISTSVAEIPLEQIVLETDCPYLTPVPHRGKRNESSYIRYVCEAVARIKGLDPEHVAAVTTENARRMFLPQGQARAGALQ